VSSEIERTTQSVFAPNHDEVLLELANARNYNDWLFMRAAPYLGARMLDVGAGIGTFSELAAARGVAVTALEPDEEFAAFLRRRFDGSIEVVQADAFAFSRPDTFDSILCFNVLEHVDDEASAVRHFRDLLAPGGRLLLLVPAHAWLFSPFDNAVGHERRYEAEPLRSLLGDGGLIVETLRYVNPVGALGWLVSMRMLRRRALPGGQVRLFDRLVPVLRPLDRVPLRFGQSLWAIARRD
jgi:SAM-dependent methyltransferase